MSKSKLVLFIVALFLSNFIVMNDYVIIPVAANIYDTFSSQIGIVNFILSGPQIIGVFGALLCGRLFGKVSKKTIILIAFSLYALAAIFGVAIENAYYMAAMRAVAGAAMGFVNTAAVALLAEIFIDEKKRSTMMGFFNAAMAGVGAIMSYAAGMLALSSWQSVYKVYWASVPILLLFVFFLPHTPPEVIVKEDKNIKKEPIPAKYIPFIISLFVFVIDYMVISYMVSLYIVEQGIGDASLAGLCTSLSTILSATMCIAFGFTYSKLKRWTVVPSYIVFCLGYVALLLFPSKLVAIIVCTLMGGAFGNGFSYFYMDGTIIVPESQVSNSMGIITAVQGLAIGVAAYFATGLMSIFKSETITGIFPILAIIAGIGAIYSIYVSIKWKDQVAKQ